MASLASSNAAGDGAHTFTMLRRSSNARLTPVAASMARRFAAFCPMNAWRWLSSIGRRCNWGAVSFRDGRGSGIAAKQKHARTQTRERERGRC